jgi:hypothetical protein
MPKNSLWVSIYMGWAHLTNPKRKDWSDWPVFLMGVEGLEWHTLSGAHEPLNKETD